jgi:hypothetical protein
VKHLPIFRASYLSNPNLDKPAGVKRKFRFIRKPITKFITKARKHERTKTRIGRNFVLSKFRNFVIKKYFNEMIYRTQKGQVSSGEAIGILLLDTSVPFIPGDVANATTYSFPVRFQKVEDFTVKRAIGKDPAMYDRLREAAEILVGQGVRAVTGDCGFMGIHQKKLAQELTVPIFLSSLLQIPFISLLLGDHAKIGVITADARGLNADLLAAVGVHDAANLVIGGLEDQPNFRAFAIEETGLLDAAAVEEEVVAMAQRMVGQEPRIAAILLECSLLPPYAVAVQQAVNLPVFDYITMINYVFAAVVQQQYSGFR